MQPKTLYEQLRALETITGVLSYGGKGAYNPFSEAEQLTFATAFKQTPNFFGTVASLFSDRNAAECVKLYYDNKWDGRFKTESLRERRPLGKGLQVSPNYLYDEDVIQIDQEIEILTTLASAEKVVVTSKTKPRHPPASFPSAMLCT